MNAEIGDLFLSGNDQKPNLLENMINTQQAANIGMNYFLLIIQNNPDLICRFSLNKEIEFMNDAIEKISGKSANCYTGKSIRSFGFPDEFLQKFEAGFDYCLKTGTVVETTMSVHEGFLTGKHFHVTFVPVSDYGLKINGLVTISRDVSREKKLEIEQQRKIEELNMLSQKVVSKADKLQNVAFIATHNLRSNVASSASLIHLYTNATSEAEKDELIEVLKESNHKLSNTLDDLLEVAKINETTGNQVDIQDLRFEDVVKQIQNLLSPLLSESNAEINMDFQDCESIMYNKIYLESIIQNLLTNAIKYRNPERNPVILLKTTMVDSGIVFSCTDNGVGINLNRFGDKIFELNRTFHGNLDARGVGLFITRNQVEALNGTIAVESKVDVGTTFTIHFSPAKV